MDHLTPEERAALRKAAEAVDSEPDFEWARGRTRLYATPEKGDGTPENYQPAAVWYDDGDMCAEVHDNMGLGYSGNRWAEFFAAASPPTVLAMLDELDGWDQRFDLQWRRMADATAMWRAATGKHMILPDLGDLLKWLMDEIERLRPKTLEESLEICRKWELTDAEVEELEK